VFWIPFGRDDVVMETGGAAAFTVMLRAAVAVWLAASWTLAVKVLVPEPVGVPVIAPVLALRIKPAGRVPERIDHVYGWVPPVAVKAAL
jgi:hypothetical protein